MHSLPPSIQAPCHSETACTSTEPHPHTTDMTTHTPGMKTTGIQIMGIETTGIEITDFEIRVIKITGIETETTEAVEVISVEDEKWSENTSER